MSEIESKLMAHEVQLANVRMLAAMVHNKLADLKALIDKTIEGLDKLDDRIARIERLARPHDHSAL